MKAEHLILGLIVLAVVVGLIVLGVTDHDMPTALELIGTGALGGLTGISLPRSTE